MGGITAELAIAVRTLAKRPAYTGVAVLTLAASIGAATLVFSVFEGVMLRPLPYPESENLHRVFATREAWRQAEQEVLRRSWDQLDITQDVVNILVGGSQGVRAAAAYVPATVRFDGAGDPVELSGARVLPGFFETLGVDAVAGRLLAEEELRSGDPVVVLSEALWDTRFGRDPDVIGRSISLEGAPHAVVGVASGDLGVPSELTQWWAPVRPDFAEGRTDLALFETVIRIERDEDPEAVAEELAAAVRALAETASGYRGVGVRLRPLAEQVLDDVENGLELLFWAVVVVALIASVNLANLVTARGARRRGELAMRAALGASRRRLVWSMLSETVVLCVAGATLGLCLAVGFLDGFLELLSWATPEFPRIDGVDINGRVLAFTAGLTILTALMAGLPPALGASGRSPWDALRSGRRGGGGGGVRRTQRSLLVVEAGLATMLLVLAGLLTRSALSVSALDPGYDAEEVAFIQIRTGTGAAATGSETDGSAVGEALEARLGRLPGVTVAARASSVPGLGGADGKVFWRPGGTAEDAPLTWTSAVSPGYFEAMGIPLLAGRGVTDGDGPDDSKVVVISELFAHRVFPGGDPLGETLHLGTGTRMEGGSVVVDGYDEVTVVGVVGDVRQLAVVLDPDAGAYLPMAQTAGDDPAFILRASGDPAVVLGDAREVVRSVAPTVLVVAADVLGDSMSRLLAPLDIRLLLVTALAVLAVLLTVAGIYGVVAYVVSEQVPEIGLRMALGAAREGESWRMLRQALEPVLVGGGLGLVGGWAASRLVENGLVGVGVLDPVAYASGLVVLVLVTVAAAWLPARRAASVDPIRVLNET